MKQSQENGVGATAQIMGTFALGSGLLGLTAWVFIPLFGAKDGRLDWTPTMNEILSNTIVDSGWAIIAIAAALLAAGLVVLTITGLNGRQTIVTLKRDAVRGVVTAFIYTATGMLTLPAWGLLAGILRIFLLQPPLPDGPQPAISEYDVKTALEDGFNSIAVGVVALMALWCARQLAEAVRMWIVPDGNALGEQRVTSLTDQMQRQHEALKRLQRKIPYRYLAGSSLPRLAAMFALRQLAIATLTLAILTAVALFGSWENTPGTESVTWVEWARLALTYLIGPNLWMPIAGWSMLAYTSLTSTPVEVDGVRKLSIGLRGVRILLSALGAFISLAFPVVYLLTIEPKSAYVVTLWIIGLIPQILIWWPWKWGRFDILLAKMARIDLAQQRNATRREIARLQGENSQETLTDLVEKCEKTYDQAETGGDGSSYSRPTAVEQKPEGAVLPEPMFLLKVGRVKLEIARTPAER